jgi:hypothetical protein
MNQSSIHAVRFKFLESIPDQAAFMNGHWNYEIENLHYHDDSFDV